MGDVLSGEKEHVRRGEEPELTACMPGHCRLIMTTCATLSHRRVRVCESEKKARESGGRGREFTDIKTLDTTEFSL